MLLNDLGEMLAMILLDSFNIGVLIQND